MEWLIDTNILVYRYDGRSRMKQQRAGEILRIGLANGNACLPHQALVEFFSVVTRPLDSATGKGLLAEHDAVRELNEMLLQFPILYPDEETLRRATGNLLTHRLSWFDAHLLAFAGQHGCPVVCSENFQHARYYGTVQAINPFLGKLPGE